MAESQKTREKLVQTSFELFLRNGYSATSVSQLRDYIDRLLATENDWSPQQSFTRRSVSKSNLKTAEKTNRP
jgi:hypothetical protein